MTAFRNVLLATLILSIGSSAIARADEKEELKIEALNALMSAPPERALPIVAKVLKGTGSDEVKEHALFVLGQIDLPEARTLLLETARTGSSDLRQKAVRAIGIGGEPSALAELGSVYAVGDEDTKEAVLEAYMIAGYTKGVYEIAASTQDTEEFENAVQMLASMGATEELRSLRDRPGGGEALIHAYAVSGDVDSLTALAADASDPERQVQAIRALGMVDSGKTGDTLIAIYRGSDVEEVKEAVREGLMIADDDEAVLELYRSSNDAAEKRELLQMLVNMDSDAVWSIIDETLEDGQ